MLKTKDMKELTGFSFNNIPEETALRERGFYWDKFIYDNVEYDVTEFLLEQATKLQP